jgi:sugar O-acyltransferase (sialic acid O-acetyltransferase NeuD family)
MNSSVKQQVHAVLIGAGGFAKECLDIIEFHNQFNPEQKIRLFGIVDDFPTQTMLEKKEIFKLKFIGTVDQLISKAEVSHNFIIAIGDTNKREEIYEQLLQGGHHPLTVIHPNTTISPSAAIGSGSVVCAGVIIGNSAEIGVCSHLNPGAVIGHDVKVGNFVSINPNSTISGNVNISANTLVGAGSTILQGLSVGKNSIIGAGSCVTRDIGPNRTVKGVPAK